MSSVRKKAESLYQSIGCQSSKEDTVISFVDSIAYTTANVKCQKKANEMLLSIGVDFPKANTIISFGKQYSICNGKCQVSEKS
jgi:hypothetical protein